MGLYDPEFKPKAFTLESRSGEVPGSVAYGGKRAKGCIWPGQNGKWFAAFAGHDSGVAFPSFDTKEEAEAYIVGPLRQAHENREAIRHQSWIDAAHKRAVRAEKAAAREAKRKTKKGEVVFDILNASGEKVGAIVRKTPQDAMNGAASLLGFCKLPDGYTVAKSA